MNGLDKCDGPITEADLKTPELGAALANMQGHILRSHGRDRSIHIFLRFLPEKSDQAKEWIAGMANRITSAQKQLREAEVYDHGNGPQGDLFCCFFLSAHGYHALKIPNLPPDPAFRQGMAPRPAYADSVAPQSAENLPALNDPPKIRWDPEYRGDIDAMLLLADDEEEKLVWEKEPLWEIQKLPQQEQLRSFEKILGLQGVAEVCAIEYGRVRRNAHGKSIEHFGYVDGRSQPLFFEKDLLKETTGGDGTDRWNPKAGPSLVLVKDPYGDPENKGIAAYGSYLVFRKLDQNVDGFQKAVEKLADDLQLKGYDRQRAEALVMGRFRDGTPLVIQSTTGMSNPVPNDFTFAGDPQGLKCPFQAHIRKVNPRGDRDRAIQSALAAAFNSSSLDGKKGYDRIQSIFATTAPTLQRLLGEGQEESDCLQKVLAAALESFLGEEQGEYDTLEKVFAAGYDERCHRIARRSVLYGVRPEELKDNPSLKPTPTVGVLFMCYQKDIRRQFEFLQANWANKEDFPSQGTGPDAMVGRVKAGKTPMPQKWPPRWKAHRKEQKDASIHSFVTLKGGEYFFAPSLSFLRGITAIAPSTAGS